MALLFSQGSVPTTQTPWTPSSTLQNLRHEAANPFSDIYRSHSGKIPIPSKKPFLSFPQQSPTSPKRTTHFRPGYRQWFDTFERSLYHLFTPVGWYENITKDKGGLLTAYNPLTNWIALLTMTNDYLKNEVRQTLVSEKWG